MVSGRSVGVCCLCGQRFANTVMSRHVAACRRETQNGSAVPAFHLRVRDRHDTDYWLHLDVPTESTLADIDWFLRDIWLECCGHMSVFEIDGEAYMHPPYYENDRSMDYSLNGTAVSDGPFLYQYDLGTPTELRMWVISRRVLGSPEIRLLARNEPPAISCFSCSAAASLHCGECFWATACSGFLCEKCDQADKHTCSDGQANPVPNSPRVGTCAYVGYEPSGIG